MNFPDTKRPDALEAEQEMYKENILDRYREPRHFGRPDKFTLSHRELNVSCGDTCEVFVRFGADGRAEEAKFDGKGCAISMAANDLLMEEIVGKKAEEIMRLEQNDILKLLGIPVGPSRMKCALLGLKTLKHGLQEAKK